MIGDVCDGRAADPGRRVVPAERIARRMLVRVEPVAVVRGQVDAADEGELAVDDHELLVMAVERPLARVERDLHTRALRECVTNRTHFPPVGPEDRQRRPGPRKQPYVDSLRRLGEQLAQRLLPIGAEAVVGREEPTGQPYRRARGLDCRRDLGQRLGAVHEDGDAVAAPRRRLGLSPTPRRLEQLSVPEPPQPPPVMRHHEPLELPAHGRIRLLDQRRKAQIRW